ncbi:MAG: HEAT repeat domain-containing protein [Myxococcota bacterium]
MFSRLPPPSRFFRLFGSVGLILALGGLVVACAEEAPPPPPPAGVPIAADAGAPTNDLEARPAPPIIDRRALAIDALLGATDVILDRERVAAMAATYDGDLFAALRGRLEGADVDTYRKSRALSVLRHLDDDRVAPYLEHYLASADELPPVLTRAAIRSYGMVAGEAAVARLETLADADDRNTRETGVHTLIAIDAPSARVVLARRADVEADPAVRALAQRGAN